MNQFKESIYNLVVDASSNLPPDVRRALAVAMKQETPKTQASLALQTIAINVDMACDGAVPICQDTGMPTFEIKTPIGANQMTMKKEIFEAIAEATKAGKLRPNSVDSLTGKNSGNNLGEGTPVVHFEQWEKDDMEVRLLLKGGGCENKKIRCPLPMVPIIRLRISAPLLIVPDFIMHAVFQ